MSASIKIFDSKLALARHVGNLLVTATKTGKDVNIALSGGSTPRDIFDVLARDFQTTINWELTRFFWGDERCVAPDHPESNWGMTMNHLFSKVPVNDKKVFRIKGEIEPEMAARDYSATLSSQLPAKDGVASFDLVILGLGEDGHTASIFPHQINSWYSEDNCVVATHPDSGQKRVSITGKIINNARQVLFIVTGKNKASVVAEIINSTGNFTSYPASLVNNKETTWLIDEDAASLLQPIDQ